MGCGEIDGAEVGLLLGWPEGSADGRKDGVSVGERLGYWEGIPSAVLNLYSA